MLIFTHLDSTMRPEMSLKHPTRREILVTLVTLEILVLYMRFQMQCKRGVLVKHHSAFITAPPALESFYYIYILRLKISL